VMNAWIFAAIAGVAVAGALACGKGREVAVGSANPSVAATATQSHCGHSACADTFFVDVTPADCVAGTVCSVAVKLVATGDFHINDEYPYRFRADDSAGVEFLGTDRAGKNAFSKAAGDWQRADAKSGAMTIRLKPSEMGSRAVAGTFKLSVCSDKNCLIEQRQLSATVQVLP
jgi:hypothetical protein